MVNSLLWQVINSNEQWHKQKFDCRNNCFWCKEKKIVVIACVHGLTSIRLMALAKEKFLNITDGDFGCEQALHPCSGCATHLRIYPILITDKIK